MAQELGLNKPEQPKPKTRRPRGKSAPKSAGQVRKPQQRRLIPPVADHVALLVIAFAVAALLTLWLEHMQYTWAAWVNAAPDGVARYGYQDILSQLVRWAQLVSNSVLACLIVTCGDRLLFTSITFTEACANEPLPGREGIFRPMTPDVQAATIRGYLTLYGAAIVSSNLVLG